MGILNVGIIGIGNMGSAHLENIASGKVDNVKVTAVCDIDNKKIKKAKERYQEIDIYENYEELVTSSGVDAVIIAVPHSLHAQIAIYAFENGKNVLLEKPADVTVSAVKKLNEAAKKSGKVFAIMFNQRTNELFRRAHDMVHNGDIGELKRSVWIITNWYRTQAYYDSGDWRATWKGEGGGVLINQAPHNLDIWQWICGMPVSVTAFCGIGKFHRIEVEDEATIYANYANGATGVFITSTGDCPGTNRLEITGTRGKLVLENGILKCWTLRSDERDICKNSKEGFVLPEMDYIEVESREETAHIGIVKNFANAILNGEELLSPGYEGINELAISNAAYLSEWTGNKKINIRFDSDEFDKMFAKMSETSKGKNVKQLDDDISRSKRWKVNW